ncbi:outer membrane beta-barrel protein [Microbulbifer sp. 2201CG32-9]|uniref:outer membrane beta-barrel protein n=1 Tax=unclassified Microbulbifer TaxID=2619833 RepID=UPI00345C228D
MTRPSFLLAVPLLSLPNLASADFYSHRYAGISFGDTGQSGFCEAADRFVQRVDAGPEMASSDKCSDTGSSVKLYAGWRWSPYLAVEASLQRLNRTELGFYLSNDLGKFLHIIDKVETHLGAGYIVGHWPLAGDSFSLFGKLGGGFWSGQLHEKQTGQDLVTFVDLNTGEVFEELDNVNRRGSNGDTGFMYGYGAGVSYVHDNAWALRLEWETLQSMGSDELRGTFDANTLSLGWSTHF